MMVASVAVLKALPVEEHHLATLSAHFRRLASGREAKRVGDLRENFLGKRREQVASGRGGGGLQPTTWFQSEASCLEDVQSHWASKQRLQTGSSRSSSSSNPAASEPGCSEME